LKDARTEHPRLRPDVAASRVRVLMRGGLGDFGLEEGERRAAVEIELRLRCPSDERVFGAGCFRAERWSDARKCMVYALEGRNGDVDEKEAVRWFSVAARSHVPEAELELSFSEEDQSRRLEYLKEAVSHGLPEAEFELGIAYVEGEATLAADIPTGMEWLTKAAERSFAPAFYRLGIMHLEGEGVEQDSVQGCGLLAVAAALAFDAPVDELLGRCRESAPEQRQAADRLASDWLSRLGSTADGGGRSR